MSFPNETPEYREARNALLASEIGLRRQMETVAAQLRALPPGGEVPEDYPDPGQDPRHLGTVEPLWTLFDLTPAGRPSGDEQMEYVCCHGPRDNSKKA
jgi:predicted dithiol-disulfide oxidoreductase (DUF899 family)